MSLTELILQIEIVLTPDYSGVGEFWVLQVFYDAKIYTFIIRICFVKYDLIMVIVVF